MARTRDQRTVPWILIVAAAALLAARVGVQFADKPQPVSDLVQWVPLERVGELAASRKKVVMIDFTADWCSPCHQLDAEVFADPEMAKRINERFVSVRVVDRKREEGRNAGNVEALEQRYNVRAFPTVVFVDADGFERGRMEGYGGREEFERVMDGIR
jgi:thiol:disulfide interchange protein